MKRYAYLALDDAPGALVERPGPGLAPTAFRIWAAGRNEADDGAVFFTPRSAELLMAEQAARNRVYSSDFDHLSVLPDRPATSGRASGWHQIEVRPDATGAPELWAVDIEWCADAKAGLEAKPPHWRYFSPAFDVSESGEITSYINFALCINPLTHGLPALAAHVDSKPKRTARMKNAEMAARLRAMAEASDDASKKEAYNIAAAAVDDMAGDDEPKDEPKDAPKKDAEAAPSDAPKEPEKKAEPSSEKPADEKKESKMAAATSAALTLAAEHVDTASRLDRLEIKELLSERTDLPEATRKWCFTQPRKVVESFLAQAAVKMAARSSSASQGETGPTLLEGEAREQMDAAMGMHADKYRAPERKPDGTFVLHTVRPSVYRAHVAQKAKA